MFLGMLLAFCLGGSLVVVLRYLRPKPQEAIRSPLKSVEGIIPRWEVEYVAARVVAALKPMVEVSAAAVRILELTRELEVECVPAQDRRQLRSWALYRGGRRLLVKAGPGWQRRLCVGLAAAIRYRLQGDADPQQKDILWFSTAIQAVADKSAD